MLDISKEELNTLISIKTKFDSLLSETGVMLPKAGGLSSAACDSCTGCRGCDGGCKGCDITTSSSLSRNLTLDDFRTVLDNLETLGPVIFNKEFLAELLLRK